VVRRTKMARTEKRLTAAGVKAATSPGMHADGGGLYLDVEIGGRRRWVWRYRFGGRRRHMGLGASPQVSLAEARASRDKWRLVLADGRDPVEARRGGSDSAEAITFGQCADRYLADREKGFRNEKHRAQWRMTLDVYAKPLREKPVASIATDDVLAVLKPIWHAKPETASRLRGRIESVIDAARVLGHIPESTPNPARWKGHLEKLLGARQKLTRGHHAAMAYVDVPAFVAALRADDSVSARALEFAILTAARTGEVIGARRDEIDTGAMLWTVPADRMKAGREHRVPLGERAVAIVKEAAALDGDFLFPGQRRGKPLSNMSMSMLLRRRGLDVTTHGFRSAFRDWAGDMTEFEREVAEAALAHAVGDQTEQAYRRGDALDKRRALMLLWQSFLETPGKTQSKPRG
jgi:integrase